MNHQFVIGNPFFTLFSFMIVCFACFTLFSMIGYPPSGSKIVAFSRKFGSSFVFGLGVWAMHVLAIFGSTYPLVLDWTMLYTLLCCMALTYASISVYESAWPGSIRKVLSSLLLAVGSTTLHYLNLLGSPVKSYELDHYLFMVSIIAAFLGALVAFNLYESRGKDGKLIGCLILGLSMIIMHTIGMQAMKVEYVNVYTTDSMNDSMMLMSFLLGIATMLIFSFCLSTWMFSRKYSMVDANYKLLVENSLDTIAIIKEGKWQYFNPSGLRMFEADSEHELIGESIYDFLHEKHHEEIRQLLGDEENEDLLRQKPVELDWRTVHGKLLHTELVRTSTSHTGSLAYQVIIRDISERKKNEELLINSEKLYIAGQLAAGIAHEIRNPLTSLKGFLQLIASGRSNNHYYEIMKSELIRIESIVSELLMLSKPQVYQLCYRDVRPIMAESVTLLETQAIMHNIEIRLNMAAEPLYVFGVENQIKQVFINVIKNAIEAMAGGGLILITLELAQKSRIVIRIQDEGPGIAKEQLSKIGQPFYTTKDRGTGLGLMVTYKIVDNHLGSIKADSIMGKGTTFIIQLPYRKDPEENT